MYYRIKENKLYDYAEYEYDKTCLLTNIITMKELQEHPNKVIVQNGVLVLNPNYEQEEADLREADFKSKFFFIDNFGWYRKQPKGYQSAVESMNVLFNIANVTDGIDVCTVTLEKTFDDVIKQGEIEGLSFDGKTNRLLVLYNRGARIIQGMPSGFYDGYDREISEVFFFDIPQELSDP